ncbi:MAG TPA: hypothetical protein VES20_09305 [Bryobacteraceae bacterium]|nr:hypothetical protein [Bryobacteraceae bacterium]
MPSRSESKRARLHTWLQEQRPAIVDSAVAEEIRRQLHPVSESYLRELLIESGFALAPEVEGVSTTSIEDVERTLLALAGCYAAGHRQVRSLVVEAKTRIRWAIAKSTDAEKRATREEMLLWVMTRLENPDLFAMWVELRKRAAAR